MNARVEPKVPPRKPARTIILPPSTFADEWDKKPKTDIVVGLRLLSEADEQHARAFASNQVVLLYTKDDDTKIVDEQAAYDTYNDCTFECCVARAICDPNDVTKPHPLFQVAEAQVPAHFTSDGIRFVWDAMHRMRVELSPLVQPIDDEGAKSVAMAILAGALTRLDRATEVSARKLIAAVSPMLPTVPADEEIEATVDTATVTYTMRAG